MIPFIPLMFVTNFSAVQSQFLPLVMVALLLDSTIISVWYLIGVLISSEKFKRSAKSEFYQLVGTAVLTMIIITSLGTFNTIFTNSVSGTIFGSQTISQLCTNIESTSNLGLLRSGTPYSFLAGISNAGADGQGTTFQGLCSYVSAQNRDPSFTSNFDYPLAATGVVIANLTNQTAANLQNFFIISSYIGYQANMKPMVGFCLQDLPDPAGPCQLPFTDPVPGQGQLVALNINATYQPFAGYNLPLSSMSTVGELLSLSLEMFMAQLTITSMLLYAWPFLLFIGLVLRATPFTRKIGGLFIAIAIGAIFFYPTVFAIEYINLGKGIPGILSDSTTSIPSIYGFNSVTYNALTTLSGSNPLVGGYLYIPNFYVQPNLEKIAQVNDCWPGIEGLNPVNLYPSLTTPSFALVSAYVSDSAWMVIPFTNVVQIILPLLRGSGSIPSHLSIPMGFFPDICSNPTHVENLAFSVINAYGLIGVSTYFLPILNLIITLSAIIGLSGLLGGDTELAGLAKLV